ncbi:MaoC family dehydratase [Planctomicrobium sp. SH661]|uniref:MaoC family dehydratase n=1 Tax=Planctomicrobium sp. SH661 TaxID=3448124 RepID=UPI003F5B8869
MQPRYYEDLEAGAVRETPGRTITETDIVVHAGHTGDFYPHHMDAEFAARTPFGQRIAHGTMTFAIAIGMKASSVNPVSFTYGFERLRFPKPVFIGDTIRVRVTLAEKAPDPKRPQYGRCIEHVEVFNQRDEVVLACDHVALVEKRPVT